MKKIVFVIEQLYGGGAERVTNALANEICKIPGYEVYILTFCGDSDMEYPRDGRIIHYNLGQNTWKNKGIVQRIMCRVRYLRQTIKQINPWCVISLAMPATVSILSFSLTGLKIPVVLSERNDPTKFPSQKIFRVLRVINYHKANAVVFQTREAMLYFDSAIQKKGTVICNPITEKLPSRFEGTRDYRVVNFCRLELQKNLDLLIDSFSLVVKDFPEYTLHIYGEGSERNRLLEKIRQMGLENCVFLPGYSRDIYEDIRSSALFVSSSDYEGMSNSMLEAMAIGVPTICTDCPAGGAREIICNGENGILVPVGDVYAMTQAIIHVLSDVELSDKLSYHGSELRNKISTSAVAEQWLTFLEKSIG